MIINFLTIIINISINEKETIWFEQFLNKKDSSSFINDWLPSASRLRLNIPSKYHNQNIYTYSKLR